MKRKKGVVVIIEVITTAIVLLAAFNHFFPRYKFKTSWNEALLFVRGRDVLITMDRMGKIHEFSTNPILLRRYLEKTLPTPYIWWAKLRFSNDTETTLLPPVPTGVGYEISYIDVNKSNLIENPGFEEGILQDAVNWTEGTNHMRTQDLTYSGTYSLKSTFTSPPLNTYTISDPIPVEPNTTYRLSGYIYRSASGDAYIEVDGGCRSNSTIQDNWEYVNCSFMTTPTTESIQVKLVTENIGGVNPQIWFDDIEIAKYEVYELDLIVGYPF